MGEAEGGSVNVVPPSDLTECQETAKMENQHLREWKRQNSEAGFRQGSNYNLGIKSVQKQ